MYPLSSIFICPLKISVLGVCPIAKNNPVIFISLVSLVKLFIVLILTTTLSPITSSTS